MKYAAFLRGINVGGHQMIKMSDLIQIFADFGFENIKTILNSGNIVFETDDSNIKTLQKRVEEEIEKTLGYHISVILKKASDIQAIIDQDPFKGIDITKETRLYVTFLQNDIKSDLKLPYSIEKKEFQILDYINGAVFSILTLTKAGRTVDLMKIVEKEYGKNSTTRNWNTVVKISKL